MSEFDEVLNNGQQSINNYDTSKIFIWRNRFKTVNYVNGTPGEITLLPGTVMGRVNATGKVDALQSSAADGSQYPLGILAQTVTLAAGANADVSICDEGDVDEDKVVFIDDYDTLDTIVDGRLIRDRINSDTVGVRLVSSTELTGYDNQ